MKQYSLVYLLIFLISCDSKNGDNIDVKNELFYYKSSRDIEQSTPFSDAVSVDNLLFLTGQIGKNHITGKLVNGGIEAEVAQTIENIKRVLEANNSDLNHVVKCTVILSNIDDFSAMNKVYKTFFTSNLPARTTFAANLVADAKVEIEVVAVKK